MTKKAARRSSCCLLPTSRGFLLGRFDAIIVGLHCMTDGYLEYEDEYLSDFDLDEA